MVEFADANDPKEGLIVDRKKLHNAIEQEFKDYKGVLLGGADPIKRDNFIAKMNYIAP
jgi:hypothetical protein